MALRSKVAGGASFLLSFSRAGACTQSLPLLTTFVYFSWVFRRLLLLRWLADSSPRRLASFYKHLPRFLPVLWGHYAAQLGRARQILGLPLPITSTLLSQLYEKNQDNIISIFTQVRIPKRIMLTGFSTNGAVFFFFINQHSIPSSYEG